MPFKDRPLTCDVHDVHTALLFSLSGLCMPFKDQHYSQGPPNCLANGYQTAATHRVQPFVSDHAAASLGHRYLRCKLPL